MGAYQEPGADGLSEKIRAIVPDIAANAAADTAANQAESKLQLAQLINESTPAHLADEAHHRSALPVQYSTDRVFDGTGTTPWREDDATRPLNVYGATKIDGVRDAGRSNSSAGCHVDNSWNLFSMSSMNTLTLAVLS